MDALGHRLGVLDAVYRDAAAPEVAFGAVTMIRRGRRSAVFVPLDGVLFDGSAITLRCGSVLVRRAPHVRAGRDLPARREAELYEHYDMPHVTPADGTPRLHRVTPSTSTLTA